MFLLFSTWRWFVKLGLVIWTTIAFYGFAVDQELVDKVDLNVAFAYQKEAAKSLSMNPHQGIEGLFDVKDGSELKGYLIINTDFTQTIGYSAKPIHLAIGVDTAGVIQGVQLLKHHEPIVLIGIPAKKIMERFDKYQGYNVVTGHLQKKLDAMQIDYLSGATVTMIVINDSIVNSVVRAFKRLGIIKTKGESQSEPLYILKPTPQIIQKLNWQALLDSGAISHLHLTVGDVDQRYLDKAKMLDDQTYQKASYRSESKDKQATFIDLYVALVSVREVGENLLGKAEYKNLKERLKENQQAVLISASGLFSFRGSGFVRGGVFDRFQLEQSDNTFRFHDYGYKRLRSVKAEGAPKFSEVGLFYIPMFEKKSQLFDATKPFQFNLLINRAIAPTEKRFYNEHLSYQLPKDYLMLDPNQPPIQKVTNASEQVQSESSDENNRAQLRLIKTIWHNNQIMVIALSIALFALTVIFFCQNALAKRAKLTKVVRYSFLCFSLIVIGFIGNGQLSVVNVLTFINSLIQQFDWYYFLRDPVIFVLWCGVACALILWARGAYCGWLCPFGALQELTNHIARKLKVPQIKVPWWLHERLWALKYIIFLVLLGTSLYSFELAEKMIEVEPFKTSIILKFARAWPFVAYVIALLVIGLFIERFFCRYLCPLGAGLAIPAKLKLFDWIKRYKNQCGNPCQICANECMVQAIHPEGEISANECLNCLHCQVRYFDQQVCPVMVKRRKRLEKATYSNQETTLKKDL